MEYVRKEGTTATVYTVGRGEKHRLLELIPASVWHRLVMVPWEVTLASVSLHFFA